MSALMESAKGMLNNGATPDVVSFAEETLADIASVATFDELVAAKTKDIDALIASIEDKTTAIGELGVQIVSMKEDLSDCEVTLLEDKKFLADLEKNCLKQSTLDAAGIASFLDQLVAVKTNKKTL